MVTTFTCNYRLHRQAGWSALRPAICIKSLCQTSICIHFSSLYIKMNADRDIILWTLLIVPPVVDKLFERNFLFCVQSDQSYFLDLISICKWMHQFRHQSVQDNTSILYDHADRNLCQTIFSSQESVSLTCYIIQIFNLLIKDHLYQSRFPLALQ